MPQWESAAAQRRLATELTDAELAELVEWSIKGALKKHQIEPKIEVRFWSVFKAVTFAYLTILIWTVLLVGFLLALNATGLLALWRMSQ
jgi:hypothetical protein